MLRKIKVKWDRCELSHGYCFHNGVENHNVATQIAVTFTKKTPWLSV